MWHVLVISDNRAFIVACNKLHSFQKLTFATWQFYNYSVHISHNFLLFFYNLLVFLIFSVL